MSDTTENIVNEETSAAETVLVKEITEIAPQPKKKSKIPLIVTLAIVVIAAVVGLIFGMNSKADNSFDPVFYFSDGGFYMKDLGALDKEAVKICDADEDLAYFLDVRLNSEHTEILFSLEEPGDDEDMFADTYSTVYYYNLLTPDIAPVKVAEKVYDYVSDESAKTVTCLVGEEDALIRFDFSGNKTEIAKNVDYFKISDDGLRMIYTVKGGSVFLKESDKEPVELSKKGTVEFADEKLSLFYLLEDGSLYKLQQGSEKELIDTNVSSTAFCAADGYYFKSVKNFLLKDLFEDDMAEADNKIKIPSDADSEAYELYSDRLARDQIRSLTLNPALTFHVQDVYYFDGKEGKEVLKNALEPEADFYSDETLSQTKLICSVVDTEKIEKILMSEVWELVQKAQEDVMSGIDHISDLIYDPLTKYSEDYFIYKGNYAEVISVKGLLSDTVFDEKNNILYLTIDDSFSMSAKLYKISYTEEGMGEPELISEKASVQDLYMTEDDKLLYLEESYSDEDEYNFVYSAYLDSKLLCENISSVSDFDFEEGFIIFEKYKLTEDNEPDFDELTQPVMYHIESDTETPLEEDTYYSLFISPAGKKLLLEENYETDEPSSNLYLFEMGARTDLKTTIPTPETYSYMNDLRDCINYDWSEFMEEAF